MFTKIWYWFLKKLYRRLVLRVVLLGEESTEYYNDIESFCKIEVSTPKGVFTFNFKEDRRLLNRPDSETVPIVNYIIKLEPPEGVTGGKVDLRDKLVLVVKILLFKLNKRVLVEVLTDIYLDSLLKETDN